ncbi:phosphatase PAP2 family protein [Actinocorallia sp. A-T 12471]|uniref:phosphatase PAP2 family protein n=1 Tax=Actinocorallia sp. A-T 12471 TaxID=3089813 RepID=UPI0029D04ABD|nr:phosphatase PAP2 family protein [Actinocorallia sp. A-T 12471]MDX6743239.1 phosphatase PAP2 family protein [Actinocorallia sp. A-T 12471]
MGGPVAAAPPRAADAVSVPPPLPDPTPKPAPRKPAPAPPTQPTPSSLRPSVRRELLLVVVFYAAYSLVRILLNDPGGPARAFANAAAVLDVERAMFLDVELALNRALVASEALSLAANLFYLGAHFAVTLAVLVWLYLARARHYAPLRTALVAATGLALVGFWLYPLAPPRFLPSEGFLDPVTVFGTPGLYASDVSAAMTNQYAAMPSMHAGWALWCGIALAVHGRRWWTRLLGVIYPVCTFAVVLATANHYVLDVVAGVALVLGALGAALGAARFKTAPRLKAVPWVSARFRRRPAR